MAAFEQKLIQIEWLGAHCEIAISLARPLFPRSIPVKFDAVAVAIAKVNRFAHTMVGCTFQRNAGAKYSSQRIREFGARRICDCKMI